MDQTTWLQLYESTTNWKVVDTHFCLCGHPRKNHNKNSGICYQVHGRMCGCQKFEEVRF